MTGPNAASSSWPHREHDPKRVAILAAADRLLAATPARSTGRLSVVQLAVEADVKYWVVAQKHTDLRDHFKQLAAQRLQAVGAPALDRSRDSFTRLRQEHHVLKQHCARLEALVQTYAIVINELVLENDAIREQSSNVAPLLTKRVRR